MNNEFSDLYTLFIAQVRRDLQAKKDVLVWCPLAEWEAAAEQWREDEGPCAATPRYVLLADDSAQPYSTWWKKVPGVEALREALHRDAKGQGFFAFGSPKALAIERWCLYALLHLSDWQAGQAHFVEECTDIWWNVRAGRLMHANTICMIHYSLCARRNRNDSSGWTNGRTTNLATPSIFVQTGAGRSKRRSRRTRRPTRRARRTTTRGARQCSSGVTIS